VGTHEDHPPSAIVAHENGPQKAKMVSAGEDDGFTTAFVFNLLGGGPDRTRICDLYRVKVGISITCGHLRPKQKTYGR
jgi:hypothetical protein